MVPPSLANALNNTYWLALCSPPPDARPLRAISMQTPGEPNRRGDPLASALLASPLPPLSIPLCVPPGQPHAELRSFKKVESAGGIIRFLAVSLRSAAG